MMGGDVETAGSEPALSAAEPVATVAEMGAGGMRVLMPHPPGSADHLPIGTKLYAAPPVPSVAVKALEWRRGSTQHRQVASVFDRPMYEVGIDNGRWYWLHNWNGLALRRVDSENEAIAAAQADYEARILSALSAQVQDVAGWQSIETAPRDGTVIDLWHFEFGRHTGMYWGKEQHCCGEEGKYCDSEWHSDVDGWIDGYQNQKSSEAEEFTHWMPLPAAPAKQEGGNVTSQ